MEEKAKKQLLDDSVNAILAAESDRDDDKASEAFQSFRRAVNYAASSMDDASLLCSVSEKTEVLGFLADLSEKRKTLHSQLSACLRTLLEVKSWAQATQNSPNICERLAAFDAGLEDLIAQTLEGRTARNALLKSFELSLGKESLCQEDQEALKEGIKMMRSLDWAYTEAKMDQSSKAFSTFRGAVIHASTLAEKRLREWDNQEAFEADGWFLVPRQLPGISAALEACAADAPDILRFLTSLNEGKVTSRNQVKEVITILVKYSPSFAEAGSTDASVAALLETAAHVHSNADGTAMTHSADADGESLLARLARRFSGSIDASESAFSETITKADTHDNAEAGSADLAEEGLVSRFVHKIMASPDSSPPALSETALNSDTNSSAEAGSAHTAEESVVTRLVKRLSGSPPASGAALRGTAANPDADSNAEAGLADAEEESSLARLLRKLSVSNASANPDADNSAENGSKGAGCESSFAHVVRGLLISGSIAWSKR